MRPSCRSLLISIVLLASLAAAPRQAGTPPPPQPTPTPSLLVTCLDDGLGKCLEQFLQRGWWGILIAILIVVFIVVWRLPPVQGWMEGSKKRGEKKYEEMVAKGEIGEATRRYLEKALEDYRYIKFRGLETRARGIESPEIDQVFVSIRMTPEVSPEERLIRGRKEISEGSVDFHGSNEPIQLTEAIKRSPKLAIVGAAGSGKSTLLQWAGLAVTRALIDQSKLTPEQRDFFFTLTDQPIVPVLFPLRAYNRYCEGKKLNRTAASLLAFISMYIDEKHPALDLPANFFESHLRQNGCLIMFDGVDEVDPTDRELVREAIEDLVREFKENPANRYLVTSRTVAYFGGAEVSGFRKCEVQNLSREQRDKLISSWCEVVYPGDEARLQAADLSKRIDDSDERVRALAITPLMVTIFALVHYDQRELPRQRAELYEHAVRILLTETYKEGVTATELRRDWEERRNHLAYVAYEMHAQGVDDLPEGDLVDLIWPGFGVQAEEKAARKAACDFVRYVADRGGLLEEHNRRYGFFTHRSFREFLAGRYLAEEKSSDEQKAILTENLGKDTWEEPIRLAAGYLAIAGERRANDFIRQLAGLGGTDIERAQASILAGFALSDLPVSNQPPVPLRAETYRQVTDPIQEQLLVNPPCVVPRLRNRLGLALGALGDPRLEPLNPRLGLVPAGTFRMGTSPDDEMHLKEQGAQSWEDEKPDHQVELSAFEIGLYPVTNMEFRLFYEDEGYDQPEVWSADGWRWRTGGWESDLSIYSEDTQKSIREWLEERPAEKRDRPFFWDNPDWNAPNLPVVGVCWFEAEAYCNWLGRMTGRRFRLPGEAQWEKAARGVEGRLWPWGDVWDAAKCNNDEAEDKIGKTSPVGIYPHGASPYGALDMAGNIWEWCHDWYAETEYQLRAASSVSDPQGPETGTARVVRGGSWYHSRDLARCAYRLRSVPDGFNYSLGFRLVVHPMDPLKS